MRPEISDRCDIVIPVWNNLILTKTCIDSIKRHTSFPHRIVVVDNASDASTRKYIETLAAEEGDKIIVIRNTENRGFVRAVNQGMKRSDAPYVCIMNNDTVATEGWLGEMVQVLRQNPAIGIINPSSNTSCQFSGDLSIDAYAKKLKAFKGKYQELYTCRAFAMIVKKEVIEKVGYLDEKYGMGYFDDTDYCKRAQSSGYITVRAKASYIYHKESQSFSKLKEKSEIFMENEKKFNSNWGRQLRVAYVLTGFGLPDEVDRISSSINRIAKIGHQVWVFTKPGIKPTLRLIDHESIRFYCYPPFLFRAIACYKIYKRRKKKGLHAILTPDKRLQRVFALCGNILRAEIFKDEDLLSVEKKLKEMSCQPLK